MTDRPFRFGIVGVPADLPSMTSLARRVEGLGYDTLVSPDPQGELDPMTTLAAAAAVTTTLHVGTFVAVERFRERRMLAWQARSLTSLTDGRFELGLGTGRPDAATRSAEMGREFGSVGARVERLGRTLAYLRQQPGRPKLLAAASGPRMLTLAAREADTVTMAWRPRTTEGEARVFIDRFREAAGARMSEIELAANLLAVGDAPAPWLERFTGVGVAELVAGGAVTVLPGAARHGADTLLRWRDELGISYITINAGYVDSFAPVVELLKNT
ncbi:LLM class flavin-dependent oxidoreductase [Actinopolymorpha sp. B11F2]|uniref:LLM class flavin-dependent oxidoreductase n=1 Tax=Actinopolymorpha sp. B11F2 TaxID=3160862 RepID=UPI0032E3CB2A